MNNPPYPSLRDLTFQVYSKKNYEINYNLDRLTINSDIIRDSYLGSYHDYNNYHETCSLFDAYLDATINRYRVKSQTKEGLMRTRPYHKGYQSGLKINFPGQFPVFIQYHPIHNHPTYLSRRAYMRVDFNPSHFDAKGIHKIIGWLKIILGSYFKQFFLGARVSRVDFNADLLGIIKEKLCCHRKHSFIYKMYVDIKDQVTESSYMGSIMARNHVLIYEKNRECTAKGKSWLYPNYQNVTRLEFCHRPHKGETTLQNLIDHHFELANLTFYYFPSNRFLRQQQVPEAVICLINLIQRHDLTRIFQHLSSAARVHLLEYLQPYRIYPINIVEMEAAYRHEVGKISELIAMTDPSYWDQDAVPASST